MGDPDTLGPRLHFPFHRRRTNRDRPSQLFPRHCSTRHLLCSCPLPLCPLNRSCLCYHGSLCTLIPPILRIHPPQHLNKNPLWSNVRGCQPNLFPPALPWTRRNASSILRLPRCLRTMKHSLIYRLPNLACRSHYVPIHPLRSIRCQT